MMAAAPASGAEPAAGCLATQVAALRTLFPAEFWERIWLTGGTVRDALLGRGGKDFDLAAALPPGVLAGRGFRLVIGRSTAPVWLRHDCDLGGVEITLLDSPDCLRSDLLRRDFTMNAIAVPLQGEAYDPLDGRAALQRGLMEPCSRETFRADPARVFRAFRFVAEGFFLSPAAAALLEGEAWDELLAVIPVERFSREMDKALAAPRPEQFFQLMHRFAVGRGFLPELFSMAAVPAGPVEYHPEGDLLSHSLQVLQRVAGETADPLARFCAFFHDIGKLATAAELYPRHHGHEEAGFGPAGELCRRLRLSSEHGRTLAWVSRLHGKANRLGTLKPSTGIQLAEQAVKGGVEEILPLVSLADSPGGLDRRLWLRLTTVARMNTGQLGIDGARLQAVPAEKRGELILQRRVDLLRSLGPPTPE
jgi:tRNA nucleotidyltransferase (CCA-adding enzyme)